VPTSPPSPSPTRSHRRNAAGHHRSHRRTRPGYGCASQLHLVRAPAAVRLQPLASHRTRLAVVGIRWLTAARSDRRCRIDDPSDWIRQELVAAFAAGARVIPVLTDGAEMPTEDQLPEDLAPLARCRCLRLRHRAAASLGKAVKATACEM
jgi:hypothetical protein